MVLRTQRKPPIVQFGGSVHFTSSWWDWEKRWGDPVEGATRVIKFMFRKAPGTRTRGGCGRESGEEGDRVSTSSCVPSAE